MINYKLIPLVAMFFCFVVLMAGCDSDPKETPVVKCEGVGGPNHDVVPGECTNPCPVDTAIETTMKATAKAAADADCKLAGKKSCNGTYSKPHGSCSTKMLGEFPQCEYTMSLEYTGSCI